MSLTQAASIMKSIWNGEKKETNSQIFISLCPIDSVISNKGAFESNYLKYMNNNAQHFESKKLIFLIQKESQSDPLVLLLDGKRSVSRRNRPLNPPLSVVGTDGKENNLTAWNCITADLRPDTITQPLGFVEGRESRHVQRPISTPYP